MNRVGYHATHETQASKMVFLDSVDCRQSTELTSHYSYSFKDAIETARDEAMLVSLSSASIPYSFYNIRAGVNDLLHYNNTLSITVPPGNYSANQLAKKLVSLFASETPAITATASYDKVTQKFTFASQAPLTFHFEEDKVTSIKNEIGFVGFSGATSVTPSSVSTSAADLNGSVHAIYVRTNLATKSVMESQTGGISDILAKIDINTDPGGVITLDPNQVSHESLIHTAGIKHIEIRITDERNRLLDLNGLHSQLAIRFRFVDTKVSPALAEIDPRHRINPKDVPDLKQREQPKPPKKKKG
jgi:hypothetical protein